MAKEDSESQDPNATRIEWTVHPIKRNWKISASVVFFLMVLCVAVYLSFDSAALLLLSVVILVSSLSSFFFPTTYILQDNCIIVRSILRKSSRQWSSFKSYYPDKNGVLLSPFSTPSRLENFRGIYIRLGHNRQEVVGFIKGKMEKRVKHEQDEDSKGHRAKG